MKLINNSIAALGFAFLVQSAAAIPITIVNGDFENPLAGGTFQTYNGPNNTINLPGWTINGSIDHIGGYWQAASGGQSLDMAGNFAGSISQNVSIPGAGTATVHFAMAGNPDNQGLKQLQVQLIGDGGPQVFLFNSAGHTHNAMGWLYDDATFNIPAAGNYTLIFSDVSGAGPWGAALDNVSMTAQVPDGGATIGLLGSGLLAIGGIRRRMK